MNMNEIKHNVEHDAVKTTKKDVLIFHCQQ